MLGATELPLRQGFASGKTLVRRTRGGGPSGRLFLRGGWPMAVPFSFLDSTDFFYAQGKQIAPVSKRRPPLSEPFNRQPRLFLQKGAELLRGSARHPLFIAELAVVLSQNEHQVTVILRQPEELAIFPLSGRAGEILIKE